MVSRTTVAGLALALGALVVALRVTGGSGGREPAGHPFLLPAAARGPASVAVSRPGQPDLALARRGGKWVFAGRGGGRADSAAVDAMLSVLARAPVRDRVSPHQRRARGLTLADYGLEEPRATVSLAFAGRESPTVSFGAGAPGGGVFALVAGGSDVVVVPRETLDSLPSGPDALRPRSLVSSDSEPPSALEIRRPGEPAIRLERGEGGAWRMASPFDAPADQAAAESLVARICGQSVRRFARLPGADDTAAAAAAARLAHGLSPDEAVASLAAWHPGDAAPETFVFGAEDPSDPGFVFAASLRDGVVCTVDKAVADAVATPLSALRERRLFPFPVSAVAGFSVDVPGRESVGLVRSGGAWRFVRPFAAAADAAAVGDFLAGVLSWRDVAASLGGGEAGRAARDGGVRLSFSLEGRPAPFEAVLHRLSPEEAAPFWVLDPERPGAPLAALEDSADPEAAFSDGSLAALRDRTVLSFPPGSVLSAEASGGDGRPLPAPAPAAAAVAALASGFRASAVSSLSASDSAAWGLLPPRVQWTVATSLPERPVAIIQLGSALPDGSAYVRIKGDPAVFTVPPDAAAVLAAVPEDMQQNDRENNQ